MARPLQRLGEKLGDGGGVALVKVTQGSVFRNFDDPNPGIRQKRGEQLPRFCHAQAISMGKIRRDVVMRQITRDSHIPFIKNPDAGGLQALKQASVSKRLRVILAPRVERACA